MNAEVNSAILDKLFDPVGQCLTPDVARRLAGLRAPADVQERLDELAGKCSDGTLTPEDSREYEAYLRTINFIGVLQAKARALLASDAATSGQNTLTFGTIASLDSRRSAVAQSDSST